MNGTLKNLAKTVQATLRESLDAYFATNQFNFVKESSVRSLRQAMEAVYLRSRPLVCIDVEAWERRPSMVTEVGVAIYDPENQLLLMQPAIKTVHIIISENRERVNAVFVPNKKYEFNGGYSYECSMAQLRKFLSQLFDHYLVKRLGSIVGHNVDGDIRWIQGMGVKLANTTVVDTQKLFDISRSRNGSLRGVLRTLGIPHANLHNAANDAYYTLLASLALCDPAQRKMFNLDTYLQFPPSELPKKVQKSAKRREKFSDRAKVNPEAPIFQEFMDSTLWWETEVEAEGVTYVKPEEAEAPGEDVSNGEEVLEGKIENKATKVSS